MEKVDVVPYETLAKLFEPQYLEDFRKRSLNPERPMQKVGQQNPDVYFQGRETVNKYYDECPGLVQHYMDKVAAPSAANTTSSITSAPPTPTRSSS